MLCNITLLKYCQKTTSYLATRLDGIVQVTQICLIAPDLIVCQSTATVGMFDPAGWVPAGTAELFVGFGEYHGVPWPLPENTQKIFSNKCKRLI